jgi:hypothetical protein
MTVWMAVARKGTAFHVITDNRRHTGCGRFVGDPDTVPYPRNGLVLDDEQAAVTGVPCKTCYVPEEDKRAQQPVAVRRIAS